MQNAYKVHNFWNLLYVPRIIKGNFGSSELQPRGDLFYKEY